MPHSQHLFDVPPDILHLFNGPDADAQRVVDLLHYGKRDVASATNVPLSSVRYDRKMPAEIRERVTEWAVAINRVARFFKDEDKTLLWFRAPNPLLGGATPRDMIRQGRFRKLLKFIHTALEENAR